MGMTSAYAVLKPLTMVLAFACVAMVARHSGRPIAFWLLMSGLFFSMVGDVFLLTEQRFIPGLIAFLIAHLCYIALFTRQAPWFANKTALVCCLGVGALIFSYLYSHGLPPAMQLPVATYVIVIAVMSAQAIGRAHILHTPAARCVAVGALSFMVSDTVLALNKFSFAVPYSFAAVLGTYYLAQWLIVHGMLDALRPDTSNK
jgi:uncharacterized membrane protein YhhN